MKTWGILLSFVVFGLSTAARADLYSAQQKASNLYYQLSNQGYRLTPTQIQQIETGLDQALATIFQPPTGFGCSVVGAGSYNGYRWNFRILNNGTTLDAADSLDTIYNKLRQLRDSRVCEPVFYASCSLGGAASYNGYRWNYTLKSNGEVLTAADSLDTITRTIQGLEQNGVCRARPTAPCVLGGAGSYNGYRWNYLITIAGETVGAADGLDTATRTMSTLRSANFCY